MHSVANLLTLLSCTISSYKWRYYEYLDHNRQKIILKN